MGKRITFADDKDGDPYAKRQKLTNAISAGAQPDGQEINTALDLKELLAFSQYAGPKLHQNIQTFKSFLESIAYGEKHAKRLEKMSCLLEYLRSTIPAEDDRTLACLASVIQIWSFAAQTNNDGLLSSVPAVLALLLKTISNMIDFRDFGVALCKTLLQKDQLRLLERGLTANKSKERLISPCLRLLTEIVLFDGGASARSLYLQRNITFKRLDVLLSMRSRVSSEKETAGEKRRPSVRNNALRYILTNLRLQHHHAKSDILAQAKLVRSIFHDIQQDSPDVVLEILDAIKSTVVQDDELSRTSKSRLLTDWTLNRILSLYDYPDGVAVTDGQVLVKDAAHAFLLYICTSIDRGVLVTEHGWYPPGTEIAEAAVTEFSDAQPSIDQQTVEHRYSDRVPVRNTILAAFIQSLRPYASVRHRALILAIFSAAPELVAWYFFTKKSFSFEPKLSATWVGYSAFIFSVIQLPVPNFRMDVDSHPRDPPSTSIVIESILPQPLTQKALTRCLNQNSELVTLFAVRLLIMAFQKLEIVLQYFHTNQRAGRATWKHAASRLRVEICQRCPELKHVIAAFRGCPKDSPILREALTRLLSMYYKSTPQLALEEKFDISIVLTDLLKIVDGTGEENKKSDSLRFLELDNLLNIACRSPDMQWWHKPEKLPLSPFTAVLMSSASRELGDTIIIGLLQSVIRDHAILQQESPQQALDALMISLRTTDKWEASLHVYQYLDNCILRYIRKPVKYLGDMADLKERAGSKCTTEPASLLLTTVLEQWPFFLEANSTADAINVAFWIAKFLTILQYIGEDSTLLLMVRDRLKAKTNDKKVEMQFNHCSISSSEESQLRILGESTQSDKEAAKGTTSTNSLSRLTEAMVSSMNISLAPPNEAEDHPALNRWSKKDISDALEDGDIGELMLCLSSKHDEIRRQAFVNLKILMAKLQPSGYSEWQQVYVLIGEVIETTKEIVGNENFSCFAGVLATRILHVLADPLHFMYDKINRFLNKSPRWNTAKLPSYWIDKAYLHAPSGDDSHYREVAWVLDALLDGLRTPAEMDIYRKCNVFERTLALSSAKTLPPTCLEKIIQLLYRCTFVDGSTTLVTRCGLLSWIDVQLAADGPHDIMLNALLSRIKSSCDEAKVSEWSNGDGFRELV